MSKHLQQLDTRIQIAGRKVFAAVASVPLNANYTLLPGLLIIPTLSGVALIA